MADKIFPQSRELLAIIEGKGWHMYELTIKDRRWTWAEMEAQGPARAFRMAESYVIAPIPNEGESQRDAYAVTKGLGPTLEIVDPADPRWLALQVSRKAIPGNLAFFSRLRFHEEALIAESPQISPSFEPDFVGMAYGSAVDTFQKYFRIITPEEVGQTTPVPFPIIPENN